LRGAIACHGPGPEPIERWLGVNGTRQQEGSKTETDNVWSVPLAHETLRVSRALH
jgi:hypothetical protein